MPVGRDIMGEVLRPRGEALGWDRAILCDFDGTITLKDTAEWVLDRHADGDWQALDKDYVEGRLTLLECMSRQFSLVRTEKAQILKELDSEVGVRQGFPELVRRARLNGSEVVIVSAGLDFVIRHYLQRMGVEGLVRLHSARTKKLDGHISFKFPSLRHQESVTFKDDEVRHWQDAGATVTYIGDGVPDVDACALADHRYAVSESRLDQELLRRGLQHS
ncbi:MAG: HAD-IB family phosphatase, partial [Methanomassiliicoccales archaeon]|nr:HAD-IB family phosphatase [Methanomassiliicoccales archaeon]